MSQNAGSAQCQRLTLAEKIAAAKPTVHMTFAEKLAIERAPQPTGRTISAPKGDDAYRILEKARRTKTDVEEELDRALGYIKHPSHTRGLPQSNMWEIPLSRKSLSKLFYYPKIIKLPDELYVSLERFRTDVMNLLKERAKASNINPQDFERYIMPEWFLPTR
jgi:hypothetical protein